jgi:hypothetical protein
MANSNAIYTPMEFGLKLNTKIILKFKNKIKSDVNLSLPKNGE